MSEVQSYLGSIYAAVLRKNGNVLAKLIFLPLEARLSTPSLSTVMDRMGTVDFTGLCTSQFKDINIANFVKSGMLAMKSVRQKDFEAAYRHQLSAYNSMMDFFSNKEESTNWTIPVLSKVSNDLRLVAQMLDEERGDLSFKFLRESLNQLTRGFTTISRDRTPMGPQTKKLGLLTITNVLFKIYFKLNTMQLCAKLIGVIEGPGGVIEHYREFSVSDVVMYKYYIGRIRMFEDRFEEAREALQFALKYTPSNNINNIRKVLALLIPVELALGVMPGKILGTKYGFPEYVQIGDAIKDGNVAKLDEWLNQYRSGFVKIGVYLVLEQTRSIALRNLFRKIYVITNSPRINLRTVESILQWLGQKISLDEIECYLANLIYQGKVKGYISHEKRFLVVSRSEPFPTSVVIKPFVSPRLT